MDHLVLPGPPAVPAAAPAVEPSAAANAQAVIESVVQSARSVLGADRASLYTVEGDVVTAVHTTETDPGLRAMIQGMAGMRRAALPVWGVLEAAEGDVLLIDDLPALDERLRPLASGAFVGARLRHGTGPDAGTLGGLFCMFGAPRALGEEQRRAAEGLARLATLALLESRRSARTEADLAETRSRLLDERAFRLLADNASDLIMRCRPDGTIVYASPSSSDLLGVGPSALVGRQITEVLGFAAGERLNVDSVPQTRCCPGPSGRGRWIETSARALRDTDGSIVEIQAVSRDVDERRRTEAIILKIAAEQRALRHVALEFARQASPDEVFAVVAERVARSVDGEAGFIARFTGTHAEVLASWARPGTELTIPAAGQRLPLGRGDAVSAADATGLPVRMALPTAGGGPEGVEMAAPIRVGGRAWGAVAVLAPEAAATPPGTEERLGRFADVLAIGVDGAIGRRERDALEVELRKAQRMEAVGQLAAGVAHEINTPIQFVSDSVHFLDDAFGDLLAFAETARALLEQVAEGTVADSIAAAGEDADIDFLAEQVPRAIARVKDGTARVSEIVQAMREVSRPSRAEQAPADLNTALRSTLTVARNELKYIADVQMDLGDIPPVVCQLGDINQVMLNLLINAAHAIADRAGPASADRGTVRVATRQEGDDVVIEIADDGCGIPEEVGDRVFDLFFTTKEVGRGTGQGLAIAHSIVVDRHGGELGFTSEVGVGTTFRISLPIAGRPDDA